MLGIPAVIQQGHHSMDRGIYLLFLCTAVAGTENACAMNLAGNRARVLDLRWLAFERSKQASLSCFKVIRWVQARIDKHDRVFY